jgi:hypothetical protein
MSILVWLCFCVGALPSECRPHILHDVPSPLAAHQTEEDMNNPRLRDGHEAGLQRKNSAAAWKEFGNKKEEAHGNKSDADRNWNDLDGGVQKTASAAWKDLGHQRQDDNKSDADRNWNDLDGGVQKTASAAWKDHGHQRQDGNKSDANRDWNDVYTGSTAQAKKGASSYGSARPSPEERKSRAQKRAEKKAAKNKVILRQSLKTTACNACTFENVEGAHNCAMCGTRLDLFLQ